MKNTRFDDFFIDDRYIKLKNSLFNYLIRKREVKMAYIKHKNSFSPLKLLDIGSGISPVSPNQQETTFMDISLHAMKLLKSLGLNAKHGSITDIPSKNGEFDWVFCSEVLEHIENYNKAIQEIHRVLKKNGKAVITIPVYMRYWDIDDEFVNHCRRFEPKEIENNLEKAGFKILQEKPIGSFFDRYMVTLIVKAFKKDRKENINNLKFYFAFAANYVLYIFARFFLKFSTKRTTNTMLYVVLKN